MVDPAVVEAFVAQLKGEKGDKGDQGDPGPAGVVGALNNMIPFSTLPGANDDDRLDKFFETYGTATRKPALVKDNLGDISLVRQHVVPKDGFKWIDPAGIGTQGDSHNGNTGMIRLRNKTGGGVFRFQDGECWGVQLIGLVFDVIPGEANRLCEPNKLCKVWKFTFADSAYANGAGILGSSAVAQPVDTLVFAGAYADFNNITDVAWNVAGADSKLNAVQTLLNSPTTLKKSGPLCVFSSMSKSAFAGFYVTAQEAQIGIHVKGGGTGGLFIGKPGDVLEGRLDVKPAWGSLARLEADTSWFGVNVNYAMTDPANGWGGAAFNRGLIHAVSGNHAAVGLVSRYAQGVGTDVPLWFQAAGSLDIAHCRATNSKGEPFRPLVRVTPAVKLFHDESVRVEVVAA